MKKAREALDKGMGTKKELFRQALELILEETKGTENPNFSGKNIIKKLNILAQKANFKGAFPRTEAAISKSDTWKGMIRMAEAKHTSKNADMIEYEWDQGNNLGEHELRMRLDMALGDFKDLQEKFKILDNALRHYNIEIDSKKQNKVTLGNEEDNSHWKEKVKILAEELLHLGLAEVTKKENAIDPYFLLNHPGAKNKKPLSYADLVELGLI